ncbi:MAG: hypothetical protein RBT63_00105, partial [Bdellovibrionales bacterium]|nr:hypothetical protein [Bdellovibrionales bacterium]
MNSTSVQRFSFFSRRILSWSLVAVTIAACSFTSDPANSQTKKSGDKPDLTLPTAKSSSPLDSSRLSAPLPANLFIELGKLINPAVVSIFSSQTPRQQMGRGGGGGRGGRDPLQDLFEQFWGAPFNRDPRSQQNPQATGLGTGFIVR